MFSTPRFAAVLFAAGACLFLGACASNPAQVYATPDEAVSALTAALTTDNTDDLNKILGPNAEDVLSSGDEVADANRRELFLAKYNEKHKLVDGPEGSKILEVGNNEWPMPIPVVPANGGWQFDLAAGKDELVSRRIGRNELDTIQTCLAICDAQREYLAMRPQGTAEYAAKFFSDSGAKNGLYWPADGGPESPLGDLVAEASAQGYTRSADPTHAPKPYHGYCYRILTAQGPDAPGGKQDYMQNGRLTGGFAVIAYPFEYGSSGIMTFIVNQQGLVYQNDLGENTESLARGMIEYNPDLNWELVGAPKPVE